jgi:hypothetical protein
MKKNRQFGSAGVALLLAVMIAFLAMPGSALAQGQTTTQPQPANQQVTGTATELFGAVFGNDLLGAAPSGWSEAGFIGNGMNSATGTASTAGSGTGGFQSAPGSASSSAATSVMSQVDVTGNLKNTATVSGTAQQANWMTVAGPDQYNFSVGGSVTDGSYDGGKTKRGAVTAIGGAGADGTSQGSVNQGVNSAQAQVLVQGEAAAVTNVPGATLASGNGIAEAGSMVGDPTNGGSFADSNVVGTVLFNGTGGKTASGSLTINGSTFGAISPTSVSATATVMSTATGSGPTLPTGPPIGHGH